MRGRNRLSSRSSFDMEGEERASGDRNGRYSQVTIQSNLLLVYMCVCEREKGKVGCSELLGIVSRKKVGY